MLITLSTMTDDLDAVMNGSSNPHKALATVEYKQMCGKCSGSGLWKAPSSLGHNRCTACHGKGYAVFKTSPAQRAKNRASAAASKAKTMDQNLAAFEAANPGFAEWWTDSTFGFAVSLREAVRKYGHLTEKQHAAATKAMAALAEKKAQAAEAKATAPVVDVAVIENTFTTAAQNGLKSPRLRLAGFVFSPAKAGSKNAGALYVKHADSGTYLGKIAGGKFLKSYECTAEQRDEVVAVASDPQGSAIAYGKVTGCCAICGRGLENQISVERGIGPICAEKFGW